MLQNEKAKHLTKDTLPLPFLHACKAHVQCTHTQKSSCMSFGISNCPVSSRPAGVHEKCTCTSGEILYSTHEEMKKSNHNFDCLLLLLSCQWGELFASILIIYTD
jgi:hypothetical protein